MGDLTRRSFLLGAASAGAVAAAGMGLAACSPQQPDTMGAGSTGGGGAAATDDVGNSIAIKGPIDEASIVETLETEVLVIGGGVSGSIAAATAAEEGKKVIVLQKAQTAFANGSGAAAWNTKAQKAAGVDFDPWQAVIDWTRAGENRADLDLLKTWIYNSGPAIDWATEKTTEVEGVGPVIFFHFDGDYPDLHNFAYPDVHMWVGQMRSLAQWMLDFAAGTGNAQVLYETPAVQIIRENNNTGRVSGAIAKNDAGDFIRVNASSAVILAAGDYGNNPVLRAQYLPHAEGLPCAYADPTQNVGDGQYMGMWIGGFMQRAPHASNIHYDPSVNVPNVAGTGMPWLFVNQNGERFCNEDMEYGQLYAQDMNQPGLMHLQIFDDNFRTDWQDMGSGMMKKEPPMDIVAGTLDAVEKGDAFSADTLDALAEAAGLPADALKKTVERYNALCDAGYDDDYGKQSGRLKPVRKAPFYAVRRQAGILCTLNGIITNGDYQALDENRNVIDGLYVTGNCQGNFFGGLEHQMIIPGMSLGRAITTGRVAGLLAAGKEIARGRM